MFWTKIQRDGWKCILFVSLLSLAQSPLEARQDVVLTMTSGEQCFGSRVTLLCTHPDPFADAVKYIQQSITWAEDSTIIDFTDSSGKRFTPTKLNSTASTLSFTVTKEHYRDREIDYTCFLVLNNANRDREESESIEIMDAIDKPLPPSVAPAPTIPPYTVSWTHDKRCYDKCSFTYILTWTKTSTPSDPSSSGGANTTESQYDLSGLPLGEYLVSIQAVCNENRAVESDVVSFHISLPGENNMITIIVIIVVVITVLGLVLIIVTIITLILICVCRSKVQITRTDVVEETATNPPRRELYRQVEYAKVYISNDRPCKPPRIPDVEYTEAMGLGQKVPTPPPEPLPPEKGVKRYITPDPVKSDELRKEVVAILQQKKIIHGSLDPDEPVVGTYQKKTFVANFVYFEDDRWDVPEREIDEMVKTRDHQGTDKGLLVTNMETLPSNLLEKLKEQHCHFIGVGRIERLDKIALMKKFDLCF